MAKELLDRHMAELPLVTPAELEYMINIRQGTADQIRQAKDAAQPIVGRALGVIFGKSVATGV